MEHIPESAIFANAIWSDYNKGEAQTSATYFAFRPVCDGNPYVFTSEIYEGATNKIQIRMGYATQPSQIVAVYDADDLPDACRAFFSLLEFDVPLYYDGVETFCEVRDIESMITQIVGCGGEVDDEESTDEIARLLAIARGERGGDRKYQAGLFSDF